jgi:hypothetical protein
MQNISNMSFTQYKGTSKTQDFSDLIHKEFQKKQFGPGILD